MPETTIKELQTDYARISAKVQKQEEALSPDAIGMASVPDLAAANKEMMADVQALREKIEANIVTLSDGRQILKHEYEALQQLARENGIEEEPVLARLTRAKIEGGQVKTISLDYLGLRIVNPLEALSGLNELDLVGNALRGNLKFPNWPKLQMLALRGNKISGVSGLCHFTELTKLGLGENSIQGDPQFPVLPKLRKLELWNNEITSTSGLANLTALTELILTGNALKGDPHFPALPKLQKLALGSNEITGISGLSHFTELTELWLGNNALRGDPQFPDWPKLQILSLSGNEITGISGLSTLTGLKTLFLAAETKVELRAEVDELLQRGLTVAGW